MNELLEILSPVVGDELARDIIAHRKGKKCPLTPRGAKALAKEYVKTGNPVEAAEEHLNRGWQGFKAEWVMKGRNFHDPHNPMPHRPGDMASLTRNMMDQYDEITGMGTRDDRGPQHALAHSSAPRRQ